MRNSFATTSQRQAIVDALQGTKETIVSDLSTSYRGTYIFSGNKSTVVPYTITAGTVSAYQGDSGTMSIDVDRQIAIGVTLDGQSITKGSDTQDIFQEIDALITAVQAGNSAGIDSGMAALDRAFNRTVQVQTAVGTSLKRLEDQATRLSGKKQVLQAHISELEDANLAETITGLQRAQAAQQANYGAAAALTRPNLMDYLK